MRVLLGIRRAQVYRLENANNNVLCLVTSQVNTRHYSNEIPLPLCDFVPKKYQGPSLQRIKAIKQTRLNPSMNHYYSEPLAIHQGYKQWLFDFEGRRYLDMFAGICTASVGHSHPKITEAVREQISLLGHTGNVYLNPKMYEYAERLTNTLPGDLKVAFFLNSGTEANDLAVMLARAYTQNFDVVGVQNCYHGSNSQVMSLISNACEKQPVPTAPGFHHTLLPDVYRGLWGGKHCRDSPSQTHRNCNCNYDECKASDNYVDQLLEVFNYDIPQKGLAGFFVEPIQGLGGVIQFPKGYLKKAHKAVKEHGGLFICDEVQCGFGRTGEYFWGFESHGIVPDIVTMAKGIGNGVPLSAVVTTPEIARSLTKASYFNTFGGNPVACAAGIAVLDIIEEERLQHNSKTIGTYLLENLCKLKEQFPVFGDVRGQGLMIGIEMVNGDGNHAPLDSERIMKFWERCRDLGVLLGKCGYFQNVLRMKPPMCVTKEDADFALAVMEKALKEFD